MFWADRLAKEIGEKYAERIKNGESLVVRDEKTLSGRVHVGSMRGAAIHGVVSEALTDLEVTNTFYWEHNDFDVFDSVPGYLPHPEFEPYLGMLLMDVPSPEPGFNNFARYYGHELQQVIENAGFSPTFYWGSEVYLSGRMDEAIREALAHASDIKRIYKEVSGGERNENWLPINVVCPQCKKVATTDATDFDGETVAVICRVKKVDYTSGCGFEGRVSPFAGKAKLPWKPEWAAKWKIMDVSVEGGGKDHSTKGGSRDVATRISREVFKYEPPFDIPYEFFLVGGKKMSSSKGRGSSAKEIADLMPAHIFRLALLSKDYNQAFNFDPEGDTIPVLYDLYDKLAEGYWSGSKDDYARLFTFVHPMHKVPSQLFLPRFSQVAFLAQMPHMNFLNEIEKLKGSNLTEAERIEANERKQYALYWLQNYAPEKFVFKLQESLPIAAQNITPIQKNALRELLEFIKSEPQMPEGDVLHHKLHEIKESQKIAPSELFSAIYNCFLGKAHGPKAGWFLSVLDYTFVIQRLTDVVV